MKKFLLVLISVFLSVSAYCSQQAAVDNILNRKSVRKYSGKKVEQEKIDTLLKCAMAAPSAKNIQPWELVVVTNKKLLKTIAQKAPNAAYAKDASVAIIVCGNTALSNEFWQQDCSAVTENILLAAEALGLGAVWCAVYPLEDRINDITKLLNLPNNILPLNIIPIGYPAGNDAPKQKFNKEKIHINKW